MLNTWDPEATPGAEHVAIAVSGAEGGHAVEFRALAATGITLLDRAEAFDDSRLSLAPDLAAEGITTILRATGHGVDYGWLRVA